MLFGELPPRLLLQVDASRFRAQGKEAVQRFALDAWPGSEVKELRLLPARHVVVSLVGLADASMESAFVLCACPAPGEPTSICDHRRPTTAEHAVLAGSNELDPMPGARRFELRLAPGRYQLWGFDMLHDLPVTEIEVAAGSGDIPIEIALR